MAEQPTPLDLAPAPGPAVTNDQPAADDPRFHSLYRRFRPQRFDQVKGQDHVTRALRNAARDAKVAHAYLFSGPRGTGKTSTARILAMALNCINLQDGEPCGVCESCVEIRRGASVDVHELDAASNRKLDEMRDLLARVALGTPGRWKVYIIDEVHQLTPDASSALLKTLEEPPGHVVFVLATTDPQKVMPTIKSRTLHFEFRLLGSDVLGDLLRTVNTQAGLGVPREAIDLVVRRGHGSARDALTVLDQVAAAGEVEDEATVISGIVDGLAARDAGQVLLAVAEATSSGRDPRRLAVDVLEHLRNGFLATMARSLVLLPDDAAIRVEEQARQLGPAALVRAMEGIGEALAGMRDSVDPRVTLEVALVRLARPDADHTPAALLERLERLERAVAKLVAATAPESPLATPLSLSRRASPAPAVSEAAGPRPPLGPDGAEQIPAPPSADKAALGAHRPSPAPRPPLRRPPGTPALRPDSPNRTPGGQEPAPPAPELPGPARRLAGVSPGPPADPSPAAPPPPPAATRTGPAVRPTPAATPPPAERLQGASPAERPQSAPPTPSRKATLAGSPAAGGDGGSPLPSRDELTKAWGDGVLRALPGKARSRFASGRFVDVESGAAVFAVPDQHLLARCEETRRDAEAALAARFGRPVPLRLVLDPGGRVAPADDAGPDGRQPPDDFDEASLAEDFADLRDAGPAVTSPEQRLLEAFPGAEEVTS